MICTVTLNASVDKAYINTSRLEPGHVFRMQSATDNAGGKGLNAARAVKTCGEEVLASGFVGGNNGRLIEELLEADGVSSRFIHVASETRCCINVLDPDGTSTELLEPGRPVTPEEVAQFDALLNEILDKVDVITFNGSLPGGMSANAYVPFIKKAKEKGVFCILDTSQDRLIQSIDACPDMIKPNSDEIAQILGREVSSIEEVAEAALELHKRGIAKVVVSLGKDGALMACKSGIYRGTPPKIQVVNPVGSGDTMVGAFAVAIARNMDDADQLRYAMSCATANCLSPKTGSFDADVATDLFEKTQVQKIG